MTAPHALTTSPSSTHHSSPKPPQTATTAINVPVARMDDAYTKATVELADKLEAYFTLVRRGM